MRLPRSLRIALHTDRVLVPQRGQRLFGYVMLVPFAGCLLTSSFTHDYLFSFIALICVLFPLIIWARATERYVLRHDPMQDKED